MISISMEEKIDMTKVELEYSDKYNELLEDRGDEFLLSRFMEAIEILKEKSLRRVLFSPEEIEILSDVLLRIGDD